VHRPARPRRSRVDPRGGRAVGVGWNEEPARREFARSGRSATRQGPTDLAPCCSGACRRASCSVGLMLGRPRGMGRSWGNDARRVSRLRACPSSAR
jgi:hypothetical protein